MLIDENGPRPTRREDYAPPAYRIRHADLTFDLDAAKTIVSSRLSIERDRAQPVQPLRLDAEDLNLLRVQVDGQNVSFRHENQQLIIDAPASDAFTLEIRNTIAPARNSKLSGLYASGSGLFTQCEAEGFRRITCYTDRPDVMATFNVTLRADKARYPVLLSNGNRVEQGDLDGGRHYARWSDPHPKPSYLFALVAADLVAREQRIRSRSGKEHLLQVYVKRGDLEKSEHAMNSLIAAIVWDEAHFNLPLDLERFMIVAVPDFNMGAMENKGLNLFNTKFVLASPATATDADFEGIERVVAHEYFHNWTGNRVTCRDWFELSLKEGLTVFRDQEFGADMAGAPSARAVRRIADVKRLRETQFVEDAGPMAHPVRPDAYYSIDNFYTPTVYEKGAEVVRMMHTLVGREGFAKGLTLYFERHDGRAVTCDDFAQAIADANPGSPLASRLETFKRWYSQAGTPRLAARGAYDAASATYTLTLSQRSPASAGQGVKQPQVIPVRMGLLGGDGAPLPLKLAGESARPECAEQLLVCDAPEQRFVFTGITQAPVPSLLRDFSAPVVLDDGLDDAGLLVLLAHDGDSFNRWEAGQRLVLNRVRAALANSAAVATLDTSHIAALRNVLRDATLDAGLKALTLHLPSERYLVDLFDEADPQRVHAIREALVDQLASTLHEDWLWAFDAHQVHAGYRAVPQQSGLRALANLALAMLVRHAVKTGGQLWPGRAFQRFKDANQMTDRLGALVALLHARSNLAESALSRLYEQFRHEPLVIDLWFALQARSPEHDGQVFERVQKLLRHPDFTLSNPNRARALLFAWQSNPSAFHRPDGAGYALWAGKVVEMDAANPQLACHFARALERWRCLAEPYRSAAHAAIGRVAGHTQLSRETREIIERALSDDLNHTS